MRRHPSGTLLVELAEEGFLEIGASRLAVD
jgi:hypothetical protein